MVELNPLQELSGAISLEAAVEAALGAPHRNEPELQAILRRASTNISEQNGFSQYCRQIIQHAHGVEDFTDLYSLLDGCKEAIPNCQLSLDGKLFDDQLQEADEDMRLAAYYGTLAWYTQRNAVVEQWIDEHADQVSDLFERAPGLRWNDSDRICRQILATSVAIHHITGGLHDYCRQSTGTDEGAEFSFVGSCTHDIRRAITFILISNIISVLGDNVQGEDQFDETFFRIQETLDQFYDRKLSPQKIPNKEKYLMVKNYIRYLKQAQSEIYECIQCLLSYPQLIELALSLKNESQGVDSVSELRSKDLPWGQITLVRKIADSEKRIFYTADGMLNTTNIAVPCHEEDGRDIMHKPLYPPTKACVIISNAASCFFDDDQKIFVSHVDRLAPPLFQFTAGESDSILRKIDTKLCLELQELWNRHPRIFSQVTDFGPFVIVNRNGEVYLLCETKSVPELAQTLGFSPHGAQQTRRIAEDTGLELRGEWSSITLEEAPESRTEESHTDAYWRNQIRALVGDRIPSLSWIVDRLKMFGDIQLLSKGKGSHCTTLFARIDCPVRRQTIWRSLAGTESISFQILWEFLEKLGIGYEEFYNSLKK